VDVENMRPMNPVTPTRLILKSSSRKYLKEIINRARGMTNAPIPKILMRESAVCDPTEPMRLCVFILPVKKYVKDGS
jgi:hypothetical protein